MSTMSEGGVQSEGGSHRHPTTSWGAAVEGTRREVRRAVYQLAEPPEGGGAVEVAARAARTGPLDPTATRPVASPAMAAIVITPEGRSSYRPAHRTVMTVGVGRAHRWRAPGGHGQACFDTVTADGLTTGRLMPTWVKSTEPPSRGVA